MAEMHLPGATRELADLRRRLAPEPEAAFRAFSKAVFAEGALDARTKQLIAVAVAHVTQCPWCIEGHVKAARKTGASREEIMEAIWVRCRDARRGRLRAFAQGAGPSGRGGGREGMSGPGERIHLARAYDARGGTQTIGARILVDRLWPRGISRADLTLDLWAKDVAPSDELRRWFGHDPGSWEEFARRYRKELAAKPEAVEELLALCRKGPVTLIYGARDTGHNNAVALRDYLGARLADEERAK